MTTESHLEGSSFPAPAANYAPGDILRHHSVPGLYSVQAITHDGKVVLIDPRGERQRVWAYDVDENFKPASRADIGSAYVLAAEEAGEL